MQTVSMWGVYKLCSTTHITKQCLLFTAADYVTMLPRMYAPCAM